MSPELLKLPWQIQVALGAGYAAYVIAYTGVKDHHKTVDTTFISVVFGLVATGVLTLTTHYRPLVSGAFSVAATLVAGILWRFRGIAWFNAALRRMDVSWSDNSPSSWATLTGDTRNHLTQIAVLHEDGTWLRCDDASQFEGAPFGPCRMGPNGDVALYLTHEDRPGEPERQLQSTRHDYWGDRITYIPANKIKQVTMRHRRPPSRSWKVAAVVVRIARWCRLVPLGKPYSTESSVDKSPQ